MSWEDIKVKIKSYFDGKGFSAWTKAGDKASLATANAAQKATMLAGVVGSLDSPLAKAANGISQVAQGFATLGPIGATIAGLKLVIDMIGDRAIKKAEEIKAAVDRMATRVRERLDKLNGARLEGLKKSLDEATTKARQAAAAFEAMASAYMKTEKAKLGTEKSARGVAASELNLDKSRAMAGAKDDNERAMLGAQYDEKIAKANLAATEEEQSGLVATAEDELVQAKQRARDARKTERDALLAKDKADKEYAEQQKIAEATGVKRDLDKFKLAAENADKAYKDAKNNRVTKVADAEVADEGLKQAKLNQTAAINEARRGIVEAESASKQLADAQKKSAHMKDLADLEKKAEKKKRDIELTHQQAKAEVELSIAKAKASGKDKEASDLEMKAKELDALEKRDLAAASVAAARKKVSAAKGQDAQELEDARRSLAVALKEEAIVNVTNKQAMLSAKTDRMPDLTAEVSHWQGEFNQAFDLWRDPDAAAAAVDADKKRGEDMKAFRKAVSRYGGKGKIDEYAALMRAGDEEGMQDRLAQWRKSSKFTPQVEQMVKAAAADQNKNAAEKSLANIDKNTTDLAKKIDELLSLK